jgi:hypothetical protein
MSESDLNFADIYQRFLNLANAIDDLNKFPKLSPDEKCLLRHLNNYWAINQKIKVVQIINLVKSSSPATVFRYLKLLRQKGYIELELDIDDNRIKYINPTELTIAYFSEHGKLLLQSTQPQVHS